MAPRKTKKRSVRVNTIPALKHSFDSLEHAVSDILRSQLSPKQRVKKFQEVWRRIFGRPVDALAAEAYLKVKSRRGGTRKQRGGAAIAGAPLDFQTRPGVDGVHGSFPAYVGSGLGFYNTITQPGLFQSCGVQNITPNVPATMGSNLVTKGGGVIQATSDALFNLSTRPFPNTTPLSGLSLMQDQALGRPPPPPAAPEQNPGLFARPN